MRNNIITIFTAIFLLFITVLFVINNYHNEKIDTLTHNKYLTVSANIKEHIQQSITQKKEQGRILALSLAQNKEYIDFFENQNNLVDLQDIIESLKKNTNQKNVWIHFVSKDGISLYRSWTKKTGDNVAVIRKELPELLSNPEPINLISVGIFDISFKSIVPVYKDDNFLGLVEVISKINSIAKSIKELGYEPIVLVDKTYKEQITKPFTKKFIGEYYVANLNANDAILERLSPNLQNILEIKNYLIKDGDFITTYHLNDIFGAPMAYFIVLKNANTIDLSDITNFNDFIKAIAVFVILIFITIILSLYFYNKSRYTKQLEISVEEKTKELVELKDYHTILFNKNPSIVFVAAINYGILEANESFFRFFSEYRSIEEFNEGNNCLCQYAIEMDDETYINPNKDWQDQVTRSNKKVCIKKDDQLFHFRLESQMLDHKIHNHVYLITLTNITELINTQKELETQKEQINQQTKLASMGQMLGNIAHQWRQPLSSISTMASGLKLHNQLNLLRESDLNTSMDLIVQQTQYLSQTIDDFRAYLKNDDNKEIVSISTIIHKVLSLEEATMKNNEILIIKAIRDDFEIEVYQNQLIQALMNILNNAKDALKSQNDCVERFVFIETVSDKNGKNIYIKDNAGGIPEDIIGRIFEPYFTTKHQSVGTGIGLSITYDIISKYHDATIKVSNETFQYNNKTYTGACFVINFQN